MSKRPYEEELNSLKSEEKKIERKRRELVAKCNHRKESNGKLKIESLGNNVFECKICRTRFDATKIAEDDMNDAVDVLHNAIQQIRCFSDKTEDRELVEYYGKIDSSLQTLPETYHRLILLSSKDNFNKKKKKHREPDSFGRYSNGSIDLLGFGGGNSGGGNKRKPW